MLRKRLVFNNRSNWTEILKNGNERDDNYARDQKEHPTELKFVLNARIRRPRAYVCMSTELPLSRCN